LWDVEGRQPSNIFTLLGHPCRAPGAWMLNQLYLAMPNPDTHWARECQTDNFHTRIWEAMLLASFREQGLLVTQEYPSPDFHVINRSGGEAWIEAVTVNPSDRYDHARAEPLTFPLNRQDRVSGIAAERYARTLRNKLRKNYTSLTHVEGKPFAIAIADFHAPGSMMWSREALITYLYGFYGREKEIDGKVVAVAETVDCLKSDPKIRAGLFNSHDNIALSAVIFSNSATLSKLSRVPVSSGALIKGYRYIRIGEFANDSAGALRGIPFSMDVASDQYRRLWEPYSYEPWTSEIEIFHNPNAENPINSTLFPEATHWLPVNGEIICKRFFKQSILKSQTIIHTQMIQFLMQIASRFRKLMRQTINYLTDLLDSHRTLLAMSAPRSQRTFNPVNSSASCQEQTYHTSAYATQIGMQLHHERKSSVLFCLHFYVP
ncbi:TPA: hypothetical protein ACNVTV_005794, partial [Citrobacter freundii]